MWTLRQPYQRFYSCKVLYLERVAWMLPYSLSAQLWISQEYKWYDITCILLKDLELEHSIYVSTMLISVSHILDIY